jgi:hypothetical protein
LPLQEAIERVGVRAVYLNPGKEGKGDPVVFFAKVPNPGPIARFLVSELIAWETEHFKTPFPIGTVKRFEPSVLRCKTA